MSKGSYVLYEGPSRIDGQPIVAIVTGLGRESKNSKTGPMAQTWILRQDRSPVDAARDGSDRSVCGDCPHRYNPATGHRTCYVTPFQAPRSIWEAWRNGRTPHRPDRIPNHKRRELRLGAYGDPAAVPMRVWLRLISDLAPRVVTGYTHQWRKVWAQEYRSHLMASIDSEGDAALATGLGWRYFGVDSEAGAGLPDAIECLSTSRGISCARCGLCNGASDTRPNVWIAAHGAQSHKVPGLQVLQ